MRQGQKIIALIVAILIPLYSAVAAPGQPAQPAAPDGVPPGADQDNTDAPAFGDIVGSLAGNYFGDKNEDDPTSRYNGWSELYDGYQGIPSLVDPKGEVKHPDLTREYPEFTFHEQSSAPGHQEPNRPSMQNYDLGVDDEVKKSNLFTYQPLRELDAGYVGSKQVRDDYLDRFASVLGVAQTTLSFLDKTVAAALNTVQAMVDNNATNLMLKQISWSQSRIADPRREGLIVDTEEKLEYCIYYKGDLEAAQAQTRIQYSSFPEDTLELEQKCGKAPRDEAGQLYRTESEALKHGLFNYCVCVSEGSATINSTLTKLDDGAPKPGYSLVDRVFYGEFEPTGQSNVDYVRQLHDVFKILYGDILLVGGQKAVETQTDDKALGPDSKQINAAGVISDGSTIPGMTIHTIRYPRLSVPQMINIFRDGCYASPECGPDTTRERCQQIIEQNHGKCPMTNLQLNYGICQSLKTLIVAYPASSEEDLRRAGIDQLPKPTPDSSLWDVYNSLFTEASLGTPVTNLDIENFRKFGNLDATSDQLTRPCYPEEDDGSLVRTCWSPQGELRRVINSFCDSSAIGAIKRLDIRIRSQVLDHIALNQRSTDREKQQLLALMDRTGAQLSLAEADVRASYMAKAALQGLGNSGDRGRELNSGASMETITGGWNNARQRSQINPFGGSPTIITPGANPG